MKTSVHCILILLLLVLAGLEPLQAQSSSAEALSINIIPPSPTAAALGKYGDHPVNYYTGVPEISIPLTTVSNKSLKLPVSLSYHAGGLKVNDIASWVGLGWSLSAGGVITRTVRGLPDEASEELPDGRRWGYNLVSHMIQEYEAGAYNNDPRQEFLHRVADGMLDTEPDEYFFNFGGKSGKIIFDGSGEAVLVPYQKLKIQYDKAEKNFLITDVSGVKYLFSEKEFTESVDACDMDPLPSFISSWYLSSIIAPTGERIDIHYLPGVTYLEVMPSERSYHALGSCSPIPRYSCKQVHKINTVRVEKITAGKTVVNFKSDTKRSDLYGLSNDFRLDQIEVSYENRPLKKYGFSYGVFGCSKLRLTQVQEHAAAVGGGSVPPYRFDYHAPESVPCVTSLAQDHWGYCNADGASTLLPEIMITVAGGEKVRVPGADRSPREDKSKIGILTKITYPTGGSTKFDYELNDYGFEIGKKVLEWETVNEPVKVDASPTNPLDTRSFTIDHAQDVKIVFNINTTEEVGQHPSTVEYIMLKQSGSSSHIFIRSEGNGEAYVTLGPGTYSFTAYSENPSTYTTASLYYKRRTNTPLVTLPTGGLRIAEIRVHDGLNINNDIVKTYHYQMSAEPNRSSGVIMGLPQYVYTYGTLAVQNCTYSVRTAISPHLGSTKGGNVGYREVSENRSDGSRTVYTYTSFYEYPDFAINGFPYPQPTSYDFYRGLPLTISHFKKSGNDDMPVQRTRNYFKLDEVANSREIRAIKVGYRFQNHSVPENDLFDVEKYQYLSRWVYQDSTVVQDFDVNGQNPVISVTKSYYHNPEHAQLTRSETVTSDGNKQVVLTTYPLDYAAGTPFIDNMKANHLVSLPIEQVSYTKRNNNFLMLSGQVTRYRDDGKGLPSSKELLKTSAPIPLSSYKFSNRAAGVLPVAGAGTLFSPDGRYESRLLYELYDPSGNLLQHRQDGMVTSHVWGYNNAFPVIKADNTTSSELNTKVGQALDEMGYANGLESFDAFLTSLGKLKTPTQKAHWTTFNDKLRAKYSSQLVTLSTYTYDPLLGITSVTDSNGRTNSYEYDDLGRLLRVLDHEGNILQSHEYHYAGN